MKNTKTALLITLWSVYQAGRRHYTTMSCDRGLKLLKKYHNVNIKRRWFFYCMRDFIEEGMIARKPRFRQNDQNLISQIPSLITFTLKGLKYLSKNKVSGAFQALKKMMAWLKSKDNRFPRQEDAMPDLTPAERDENIRKLKLLFKKVGVPG